jgi:hypothetical protein
MGKSLETSLVQLGYRSDVLTGTVNTTVYLSTA